MAVKNAQSTQFPMRIEAGAIRVVTEKSLSLAWQHAPSAVPASREEKELSAQLAQRENTELQIVVMGARNAQVPLEQTTTSLIV